MSRRGCRNQAAARCLVGVLTLLMLLSMQGCRERTSPDATKRTAPEWTREDCLKVLNDLKVDGFRKLGFEAELKHAKEIVRNQGIPETPYLFMATLTIPLNFRTSGSGLCMRYLLKGCDIKGIHLRIVPQGDKGRALMWSSDLLNVHLIVGPRAHVSYLGFSIFFQDVTELSTTTEEVGFVDCVALRVPEKYWRNADFYVRIYDSKGNTSNELKVKIIRLEDVLKQEGT